MSRLVLLAMRNTSSAAIKRVEIKASVHSQIGESPQKETFSYPGLEREEKLLVPLSYSRPDSLNRAVGLYPQQTVGEVVYYDAVDGEALTLHPRERRNMVRRIGLGLDSIYNIGATMLMPVEDLDSGVIVPIVPSE